MKNSVPVWMKIYTAISGILILLLCTYSFTDLFSSDVITTERINIVDRNGNIRMVLSNSEQQHPGTIGGLSFDRERQAGIIFFNEVGDENGGLIFQGDSTEAGMVLSYDQFADDQLMQLQYLEDVRNNERKYGLQLWRFPKQYTFVEREMRYQAIDTMESQAAINKALKQMEADSLLSSDRLFLGQNWNDESGLFINDREGNIRIKVYVDSNDQPKIEFYDQYGTLQKSLD